MCIARQSTDLGGGKGSDVQETRDTYRCAGVVLSCSFGLSATRGSSSVYIVEGVVASGGVLGLFSNLIGNACGEISGLAGTMVGSES